MHGGLPGARIVGNTVDDIQNVDPAFIQKICDKPTLTPGRSNGFFNSLNVIKNKAKELEATCEATELTEDQIHTPRSRKLRRTLFDILREAFHSVFFALFLFIIEIMDASIYLDR
jgi:hypothetical protein